MIIVVGFFSPPKALMKVGIKWKWHVFFATWFDYREGRFITREVDPGRASSHKMNARMCLL